MIAERHLQGFVRDRMSAHSVPGTAIALTHEDRRAIYPIGITALDTQFPIRPDTLFQIGSITKPYTASLLVALDDLGAIDVDMPVRNYVPDFNLASSRAAQEITVRQLLTHQSGFWGDWFEDFGLGDDAIERFVSEFHRLPQQFDPGSMWAYNNCGYILAGLVASRVTDTTFERALNKHIFGPLGLDHTVLSAADAIAFPVGVGHTNDTETGEARIARQFLRPRARNPAGGVLASAVDVITFAEALLSNEPGFISSEARDRMHHRETATFETDTYWGLGFKIEDRLGGIVVGHGGATNGFRAELAMVPEARFAIAVLTNSDSGGAFASELVDWVLEQEFRITTPEHPQVSMPSTDHGRLEGRYEHPYATIEIRSHDSDLQGRVTTHSPYSERSEPKTGRWFELSPIGGDRFVAGGGPFAGSQMKIWRHENDDPRFLQAGGRLFVPGSWNDVYQGG